MIKHAIGIIMSGAAGYLAGDAGGAIVAALAWLVAVLTWRTLAPGFARTRGSEAWSRSSIYADIEDIIDCLDDLARERGWDFPKRLAIAQLACENRTTTFDELERCYDRGLRPALAAAGPEDPEWEARTGA